MKRIVSLVLSLVLVLSVFTVSPVRAADSITFDSAVQTGKGTGTITVDLKFSEPVHLFSELFIKLCDRYNPTPGVGGSYQYNYTSGTVNYVSGTTAADTFVYSDTLRITFNITGGTGVSELPAGAGIRIVEYGKPTAGDGLVSTEVIRGIDGKAVDATNADGSVDIAWKSITPAITLDKVEFNGYIADLTFSAPVHFFNLAAAIRSCQDYLGASPQYQPRRAEYIGTTTTVGSDVYSKTVRVFFYSASSKIDIALHGVTPQATTGVRLIEFTGGDGANWMVSRSNIAGINGVPVMATIQQGSSDITFRAADTINSLPQFVSAEVTDPSSYKVRLNFSAPVHFFTLGFVKLCDSYNPNPGVGGSYQTQANTYEYVSPTIGADGKEYSTAIDVTFDTVSGYPEMPTNAGVRIVEYGITDYLGDGSVSPTILRTEDGLPVAATIQSGSVDIAWKPIAWTGASARPMSCEVVNEAARTVKVSFTLPVSLSSLSGITAAGNGWNGTVTSAVPESPVNISGTDYSATWTIVLPASADMADEDGKVLFTAASMADKYGRGLLATTDISGVDYAVVFLSPWQDTSIDHGTDFSAEFTSGEEYNFMNCDTGRSLSIGGVDEYKLVKEPGVNMYSLKDPATGKYVNLSGSVPVLTDARCLLMLRKCDNERYQIVVAGYTVLADDDSGTDNTAVLTRLPDDKTTIDSGWYITQKGADRPLRVMPLGDSITFGINPDLAVGEPRPGYRVALAENLTDYLGRVVFVGSVTANRTDVSDKALNRHAGFSGYVIEDIWGEAGHPGVKPLMPELLAKYSPDVVLCLLGANDVSRMINAGAYTDALLDEEMERYKNFLDDIEAALPANGTLVCSTLMPRAEGSSVDVKQQVTGKFNSLLKTMIYDMADAGKKVVLSDGYLPVNDLPGMGLSGDKIHLNTSGYAALSGQYLDVFRGVYKSDTDKQDYDVALQVCDGVTLTEVDGGAGGIVPGRSYGFTLDVADGFRGNPIVTVDGVEARAVNGVYRLRGILGNHTIVINGVEQVLYSVAVRFTEGGTVDPAAGGSYPVGTDVNITITPDEGYEVEHVYVDGGDLGSITELSFDDISSNHRMSVVFAAQKALKGAGVSAGSSNPSTGQMALIAIPLFIIAAGLVFGGITLTALKRKEAALASADADVQTDTTAE